MTQQFYIAGELRSSETVSSIVNPYTGSKITDIFISGSHHIEEAIRSAQEGYHVTAQYSSYDRAEILNNIAGALRKKKEIFASLITAESGKPITFARAEVDRAIATLTIAAEESKRIVGEVIPLDITPASSKRQGIVRRFPIGVIACITPFNFPLNLVVHKIAPAIASGNSFILKPPPQTPLTSLLLGELLVSSGLEKKTINILPANNADAELLVTDDRIAMVSFTGSATVGWMIKQKAGKKKIVLELGGNAGVIVDASADIAHAVSRCVVGGFGYAGQVCIKVQRIIVQESVYKQFEDQFLEATSKVVTGDPFDEKTIVGPMISEAESKRVESWVKESTGQGARIALGGSRHGVMFEPTVLINVNSTMKVCAEEIFGPVVTLEPYSTIHDAVDMVNIGKYGLQTGIFSNDLSSVQYAYEHLNVGGLIVNDYPTFRVDNMPYGGVKDSGFGREGVAYAIKEMTEPKLLVL
jgi:glyceraldehyde-3-phosphate dehydrogenase (NADP+)